MHARDLARTADFYGNVLGLPLAADQGSCRIYRVSRGGYVGFCEHISAPDRPESVIITLLTEDVDGWHRSLESIGVIFETKPAENPSFRIYHCFLRDPNGYRIEIQRFLNQEWNISDH